MSSTAKGYSLHGYQNSAITHLYEQDQSLLLAPMGAGKTAILLTTIAELLGDGSAGRVLVVAPLRVAELVWPAEREIWGRGLTMSVATGTPAERLAALREHTDICVINVENLLWLVREHRQLLELFDVLVVDELSKFKSTKSKRWRELRPHLKHFRIRIGATGTPTSNGLGDLYAQVYMIDDGAAFGRTVTAWRERYFTNTAPPRANYEKWEPKPGAQDQIMDAIAHLTYIVTPADAVELPELVTNVVPVEMPMDDYRVMERDLVLGDVAAANPAVLTGKLAQMTQGFLYLEDGSVRPLHQAKLDALRETVDELQGENVIVLYRFHEDLRRIQSVYPDAPDLGSGTSGKRAAEIVEDWNAGRIPLLTLHPASAAHGLNLQHGGHNAIWYAPTWSLEEYDQACARIHRQGQTERTFMHLLIARGTVDEDIMTAIRDKRSVRECLVEGLKRRQGNA